MIRDYWIYQKRDVQTPWALYVVKEFDRRNPSATVIDYTLYHEDIDSATHSKSFVGLHYETIAGYVNDIVTQISEITEVHVQDLEQLNISIERILLD